MRPPGEAVGTIAALLFSSAGILKKMGIPETDYCARRSNLLGRVCEAVPSMQRRAEKLDREIIFPADDFAELHTFGALAAVVPQRFGGLGLGTEPNGALGLHELLRLLGRGNLSVGRVFEGHVNAFQLIASYGDQGQLRQAAQDARDGRLFAIWNTEIRPGLRITPGAAGIQLQGTKSFCSAAGHATRALVTATDPQGRLLMLLVPLNLGERAEPLDNAPQGMRASLTGRVTFDGLSVSTSAVIGNPGDYIREPVFSGGAWRTSAVTLGGLEALVAEAQRQLVARGRHNDPHQQARMGQILIAQETALLWTREAAMIAEGGQATSPNTTAYVNLARVAVESATLDAMRQIQRSLGLAGFLPPNPIERILRDLGTYLRQPAPDEALTEAADWFTAHALVDVPRLLTPPTL